MNYAGGTATTWFHILDTKVRRTGNASATIVRKISPPPRESEASSRLMAITWRGLTLLTCPCCIPIWIAVLSGTAAGALLTRNIILTVALFIVLFLFSFWKALHTYDSQSDDSLKGDRDGAR